VKQYGKEEMGQDRRTKERKAQSPHETNRKEEVMAHG